MMMVSPHHGFDDLSYARKLQEEYDREAASQLAEENVDTQNDRSSSNLRNSHHLPVVNVSSSLSVSPVDPSLELSDPNPNIRELFLQYNEQFFWGRLAGIEVRWSPRMTLCAGLCVYEGRGGLCSVRLSQPLLKLRPRKDLVETLLHEMIHAYLFITDNDRDHDGHGPQFQKHMHRINKETGAHISIYHTFHDEVESYQQHWWRCNGPCQQRRPYYGYVKRAMNRAPSARDPWFAEHQATCGGTFTKIKEPEGYGQKKTGKKKENEGKVKDPSMDIRAFVGKGKTLGSPDKLKNIKNKTTSHSATGSNKPFGTANNPASIFGINKQNNSANGTSQDKKKSIIVNGILVPIGSKQSSLFSTIKAGSVNPSSTASASETFTKPLAITSASTSTSNPSNTNPSTVSDGQKKNVAGISSTNNTSVSATSSQMKELSNSFDDFLDDDDDDLLMSSMDVTDPLTDTGASLSQCSQQSDCGECIDLTDSSEETAGETSFYNKQKQPKIKVRSGNVQGHLSNTVSQKRIVDIYNNKDDSDFKPAKQGSKNTPSSFTTKDGTLKKKKSPFSSNHERQNKKTGGNLMKQKTRTGSGNTAVDIFRRRINGKGKGSTNKFGKKFVSVCEGSDFINPMENPSEKKKAEKKYVFDDLDSNDGLWEEGCNKVKKDDDAIPLSTFCKKKVQEKIDSSSTSPLKSVAKTTNHVPSTSSQTIQQHSDQSNKHGKFKGPGYKLGSGESGPSYLSQIRRTFHNDRVKNDYKPKPSSSHSNSENATFTSRIESTPLETSTSKKRNSSEAFSDDDSDHESVVKKISIGNVGDIQAGNAEEVSDDRRGGNRGGHGNNEEAENLNTMVSCPVCSTLVESDSINAHLDLCLTGA